MGKPLKKTRQKTVPLPTGRFLNLKLETDLGSVLRLIAAIVHLLS